MKWFRLPQIFPKTPPHRDPRDWRASVALVASILGSIAMTGFSLTLVYIMWAGAWPVSTAEARVHILGKALMMSLMGSLVVLTTLGFAINRRTIKFNRDGFEATGGDDAPDPVAPTPPVVTTTTTTAVTVPAPTPASVPAAPEPDPAPDADQTGAHNGD